MCVYACRYVGFTRTPPFFFHLGVSGMRLTFTYSLYNTFLLVPSFASEHFLLRLVFFFFVVRSKTNVSSIHIIYYRSDPWTRYSVSCFFFLHQSGIGGILECHVSDRWPFSMAKMWTRRRYEPVFYEVKALCAAAAAPTTTTTTTCSIPILWSPCVSIFSQLYYDARTLYRIYSPLFT